MPDQWSQEPIQFRNYAKICIRQSMRFKYQTTDVSLNQMKIGDFFLILRIYIQNGLLCFLDVEASSKVARAGAPATLTCRVTGLAEDNAVEISWLPSNSGVSAGGNLDSGTQTSTLIIDDPQTDKSYSCVVSSTLYQDSPESTTEQFLDIFSKFLWRRKA